MYDPVTRRGILNDFDLARLQRQDGKPSGKDNTGTMPFMALDLLNPEAFQGMVPRLYRHDAESFAWCLVYILPAKVIITQQVSSKRRTQFVILLKTNAGFHSTLNSTPHSFRDIRLLG